MYFDPQVRYIPGLNPSNPGRLIDFTTEEFQRKLPAFADSIQPYKWMGFDHKHAFQGTMFRLPLRTASQAEGSRLSRTARGAGSTEELLLEFAQQSTEMLLFLKHVLRVKIYKWSSGEDAPALISCTQVLNADGGLASARGFMGSQQCASRAPGQMVTRDFEMSIEYSGPGAVGTQAGTAAAGAAAEELTAATTVTEVSTWLVANQMGGPDADAVAAKPDVKQLKLQPWSGVAACVSRHCPPGQTADGSASAAQGAALAGRAYCFLPLPVVTGLPVHVNGYFELSSNRRDIWLGDRDMIGQGRLRAEWNAALLKDIAAPCYARVLLAAVARAQKRMGDDASAVPRELASLYALWPQALPSAPAWRSVVQGALRNLQSRAVLYAAPASSTPLVDGSVPDAAAGIGAWVAPQDAVVCGDGVDSAWPGLRRALVLEGVPLVQLPAAVCSVLKDTACLREQQLLSPEVVRTQYRAAAGRHGAGCPSLEEQAVGIQLLKYVCSDLLLSTAPGVQQGRAAAGDAGLAASADFSPLVGLPLLPLASGEMAVFAAPPSKEYTDTLKELHAFGFAMADCAAAVLHVQEHYPAVAARGQAALREQALHVLAEGGQLQQTQADAGQAVFFPTALQRSVLAAAPAARARMVAAPAVLGEQAAAILGRPALKAATNVSEVGPSDMAELIALALPSDWASQRSVQWEVGAAGQPAPEWLCELWAYLAAEVLDLAPFVDGLPIVPVMGGRLVSLQAAPCCITVHLEGAAAQDAAVLQRLGLHVLDTAATGLAALHADMHRYLFDSSPGGILGALYARAGAAHISGSLSPPASAAKRVQLSEDSLDIVMADEAQQNMADQLHNNIEGILASAADGCETRLRLAQLLSTAQVPKLPEHLALLLQCLSVFPACCGLEVSPSGDAMLRVAFVAALPFVPAAQAVVGDGATQDSPAAAATAVASGHIPRRAMLWPKSLQLMPDIFSTSGGLAPLAPPSVLGEGVGAAVHTLAVALGLPKPSAESTMLQVLLPLLESSSTVLATAIGCTILQGLPSTAGQACVERLRSVPMLRRAGAAAAGKQEQMAAACDLYDMRSEELKALLPETMFPASTAQCLLTWGELREELRRQGAAGAAAADESHPQDQHAQQQSEMLQHSRQILNETALASLQRLGVRTVLGQREVLHAVAAIGSTSDREAARRVFKYVNGHAFDLFGRWVGPEAMPRADAIAFHGGDGLTSAIAGARELETRRLQEEQRRAKKGSGFLSRMFASSGDEPLPPVIIDERSLPEYAAAERSWEERTAEAQSLVGELQETPWIPICTSSGEAHAAWAHAVGEQVSAGVPSTAVPWPEDVIAPFAAVKPAGTAKAHSIVRAHSIWTHSGSALVLREATSDESMLWLLGCSGQSTPLLTPLQAAAQLLLISSACSGADVPDALVQLLHPVVVSLTREIHSAVQGGSADSQGVTALQKQLDGKAWAWTQSASGFVGASMMACTQDFDCRPYLFALPAALGFASDSLVQLGVQRTFGGQAFAQLLSELKARKGGTALSTHEVDMCVFAISRLSESVDGAQGSARLLLDEDGVLRPAQRCVYNDYGGDKGTAGVQDVRASKSGEDAMFMLHDKVPNAAAKALGAASLTRRMLASNSELLPMGMESFGQSEDLTQRIRHITDMYPEGSSMVAEHVQNADDAGASVVKIVLDAHTYGTESLFGDGLAKWQGPALMVYNDGVFSESDFAAISRVGQAGKMDKLNSTGRFGLGFCGNYAVTDLPCIVSSDSLVMFDPHLQSVPGADAQQPGMRMRFADSTAATGAALAAAAVEADVPAPLGKLAEQYSDQLAPYVAMGCSFNGPLQGTIFRFPLRNTETAASSKIKPHDPIADDPHRALLGMCEAYRSVSEYVLLFTKSVRRVECSYVPPGQPGGERPLEQPVFSVQVGGRSLVPRHGVEVVPPLDWSVVPWGDSAELREAADAAWTACGRFLKYGTSQPTQGSQPISKSQAMEVVHSTSPPELPSTYQVLTVSIEDHGVPTTGGATTSRPHRKLHEYFVHSRLGAGNARKMAFQHRDTLKFVPGASVAVLLAVNGQPVCIEPKAVVSSAPSAADASDTAADMASQTALGGGTAADMYEAVEAGAGTPSVPEEVTLDVRFQGEEPSPARMPQGVEALGLTVLANGRAFCTLPLPASTGLPVLVSAGFELASDRRNLRHGRDMEGAAKIKAQWNEALLQDVVAPSYCRLLLQIRDSFDGRQYGAVSVSRLVAEARGLLALGGGNTRISQPLVADGTCGAQAVCTMGALEDDSALLPTGRKLGTIGSLTAYYAMWPRGAAVAPFASITSAAASAVFRLKLCVFFAPAHAPKSAPASSVLALGSWVPAGRSDQDTLFLPMQDADFRTLDRLLRLDQEDSLLEHAAFFAEQGMARMVLEVWPALLRLGRPVVPVPTHVFHFLQEHTLTTWKVAAVSPSSVRDAFRSAALPAAGDGGRLSDDDSLLLQRSALYACEDLPLAVEQQLGFYGSADMQKHLATLTDSADSKLARVLLAASHCAGALDSCALRPGETTAETWEAVAASMGAPDRKRVYAVEQSEAGEAIWQSGKGTVAGAASWTLGHSPSAGSMNQTMQRLAELACQAQTLLFLDSDEAAQQLVELGLADTLGVRVQAALKVVRDCEPDLRLLRLGTATCKLHVPLPSAVESMCLLHHAAVVFADCFLHGVPSVWASSPAATIPWVPAAPGAAAAPGPMQDSAPQPSKRWMQCLWRWLSGRLRHCVSAAEEAQAAQLTQSNVWRVFEEHKLPAIPTYTLSLDDEGRTRTSHCMVNLWAAGQSVVVFDPRGYSSSLVALLCSYGALALDVVSMGCPAHAPGVTETWHTCHPAAVSILALVQSKAVCGRTAPQLLELLVSSVKHKLPAASASSADALMVSALQYARSSDVSAADLSAAAVDLSAVHPELPQLLQALTPARTGADTGKTQAIMHRAWSEVHCILMKGLQTGVGDASVPQWDGGDCITDRQAAWMACLPLWRSFGAFAAAQGKPFPDSCTGIDRLEGTHLLHSRLLPPRDVHPIVLDARFLAAGGCFFSADSHSNSTSAVVCQQAEQAELHFMKYVGVHSVSMDVLVTGHLLPAVAEAAPVVKGATTWAIARAVHSKLVNSDTILQLRDSRWVVASNPSDADAPLLDGSGTGQSGSAGSRVPVRLAAPTELYLRSTPLEALLPRTCLSARRPLLPQSAVLREFRVGATEPQWLNDSFGLLTEAAARTLDGGLTAAGVNEDLKPQGVLVAARCMAAESAAIAAEAAQRAPGAGAHDAASGSASARPLDQLTRYSDIPVQHRTAILQSRAMQLLRYLAAGSNLMGLCRACADTQLTPEAFMRELGDISWLPAQQSNIVIAGAPPLPSRGLPLWQPCQVRGALAASALSASFARLMHSAPPVPQDLHRRNFPQVFALSVDETQGVAVPRALQHAWGWDRPAQPAVYAAQLLAMGEAWAQLTANGKEAAYAHVMDVCTLLYGLLSLSLGLPHPHEQSNAMHTSYQRDFDVLTAAGDKSPTHSQEQCAAADAVRSGALASGAWVFVGAEGGFLPAQRVALQGMEAARPHLFELPQELQQFKGMFKALGVSETFSASSLCSSIASLAEPLSDGDAGFTAVALQTLHAGCHSSFHTHADSNQGGGDDALAAWRQTVAAFPLVAPDSAGRLHPLPALVVDDCPGMPAEDKQQLVQEYFAPHAALAAIGSSLLALGCSPLSALLCGATEGSVSRMVGLQAARHPENGVGGGMHTAVADLMELALCMGSSSCHVAVSNQQLAAVSAAGDAAPPHFAAGPLEPHLSVVMGGTVISQEGVQCLAGSTSGAQFPKPEHVRGQGPLRALNGGSPGLLGALNVGNSCIVLSGSHLYCLNAHRVRCADDTQPGELLCMDLSHPSAAYLQPTLGAWVAHACMQLQAEVLAVGTVGFFVQAVCVCVPFGLRGSALGGAALPALLERACELKPHSLGFTLPSDVATEPSGEQFVGAVAPAALSLGKLWQGALEAVRYSVVGAAPLQEASLSLRSEQPARCRVMKVTKMQLDDAAHAAVLPPPEGVSRVMPRGAGGGIVAGLFKRASAAVGSSADAVHSILTELDMGDDRPGVESPASRVRLSFQETWVSSQPKVVDAAGRIPAVRLLAPVDRKIVSVEIPGLQWPDVDPHTHACFNSGDAGAVSLVSCCPACVLPGGASRTGQAEDGRVRSGRMWLRGIRTDIPSLLPVDVCIDGAVDSQHRRLLLPLPQAQAPPAATAGAAASADKPAALATPPAAEWNAVALQQHVRVLYPALVAAWTHVSRRAQWAQADAFELWPQPLLAEAGADAALASAMAFDSVEHLGQCSVWPRWRPGTAEEAALRADRARALRASGVTTGQREALQFGQRCIVSKALHITADTPAAVAHFMCGWQPLVLLPRRLLQQLQAAAATEEQAAETHSQPSKPFMALRTISPATVADSIQQAVAQSRSLLYSSSLMAAFVLSYVLAPPSAQPGAAQRVPGAVQWHTQLDTQAVSAEALQGAPLLPLASGGMLPCGGRGRQRAWVASMSQLMLCDGDFLAGEAESCVAQVPLLGQALHPGLLVSSSVPGLVRAPALPAYKRRYNAHEACACAGLFSPGDVSWAAEGVTHAAASDAPRAQLGLALLGVADMVPHLRRVLPVQLHSGPWHRWAVKRETGDAAPAATAAGDPAPHSVYLSPLWLRLFWNTVHFSKEDNLRALGGLCLVPLRSGHLLACNLSQAAAPEKQEQAGLFRALQQAEEALSGTGFPEASAVAARGMVGGPTGGAAGGEDALGDWLRHCGGSVLHSAFIPRGHRASSGDAAALARVQVCSVMAFGDLPGQRGRFGPGGTWAGLKSEQRDGFLVALQSSGCSMDDSLKTFVQRQELFETISGGYRGVHAVEAVTLSADTLLVDDSVIGAFQAQCGGRELPVGTRSAFSDVLKMTTGAALADTAVDAASDPSTVGGAGGAAAGAGGVLYLSSAEQISDNSVFLAPKPHLAGVYETLGVKPAELPSILRKHVLPRFAELPAPAQAALAAAMCARWGSLRGDAQLKRMLQDMQWVPSDAALAQTASPAAAAGGGVDLGDAVTAYAGGHLACPRELLHPHHRLARRAVQPGHGVFPHPACCTPGWLAVLLDVDMAAVMSAEHAVTALRQVQQRALGAGPQGPVPETGTAGVAVDRALALTAMDLLRVAWVAVRPASDGVPPEALRAQRAQFPATTEQQRNNSDASSTPLLLLEGHQRAVASLCVVPCWRPGALCRQLTPLDLEADAEGGEGGAKPHPPHDIVLLPYSLCIRKTHALLAWTQLGVMPQDCTPPVAAWPRVQLPETPATAAIVRHMQALAAADSTEGWKDATLEHWCAPEPPLACLACALQALSAPGQQLSDEHAQWLRTAAFVPVGASYVPLRRLFFRLPRASAIAPLAFEVPRALGAHEQWLKRMGVAETPGAQQYCQLLREITVDSAGGALSPAELQGALCIAELLGGAVAAQGRGGVAAGAGDGSLDMAGFSQEQVCIPDVFAVMRPAQSCHVNDMPWATPFLSADAVLLAHPQLDPEAALALGGTRLSTAVQEDRSAGPAAEPSPALPSPAALAAALQSAEFAGAVVAAAAAGRHEQAAGQAPPALTHSQLRAHEAAVHRALMALQVDLVQRVTSTLRVGKLQIAQCSALWCAAQAAETQSLQVSTSHFGAGVLPSEAVCRAAVQWLVAPGRLAPATAALCQGGLKGDALNALGVFVGQALQGTPQAAKDAFGLTLQAFRLPGGQGSAGDRASASSVIQQQLLRGVPGEPLQSGDASCVALQPTRRFTPGDVVAVDASVASGAAETGGGGQVYGRVAEVAAAGDGTALISALRVELGPLGTHDLRSDQVFVFAASKRSGKAQAAAGAAAAPPPPLDTQAATEGVAPPVVPQGGEGGLQPSGHQELLLQALAELRQRAGLGSSAAEADAVRAVAQHRAAAEAAGAEVARLQERLGQATAAAAEAQGMVACGICQDAEVDHVLVPCGHTICGGCLGRMTREQCPFCRKQLQQKVKMYHP